MVKITQKKVQYDDESDMNEDIDLFLSLGWRVVCMLELMHIYVIYEIEEEIEED